MKFWRVLGFAVVLFLIVGSVSADSSTQSVFSLTKPWTREYVSRYALANVGTHVAIAHHPTTGRAYISYYDAVNADLVMAHEVSKGTGNCPGNDDWKCEVVDSDDSVGKYTSIDVTEVPENFPHPSYTKVAISYYHQTSQSLRVALYASYPYPGGWTIHTVDDSALPTNTRGTYTSLKFPEGSYLPLIAYHASSELNTTGSVKIASWIGGGNGNCGDDNSWHCETVDSGDGLDYGSHVSMDINQNDGTAYIAFYEPYWGTVRLAHYYGFGGSCSNPDYECQDIDEINHVGQYLSLHAPDNTADVMRLVYYDEDVEWVKVAEYVGTGGNCFSTTAYDCYYLEDTNLPATNFDLAQTVDEDGYPVIVYTVATEEMGPTQLRMARPASTYDQVFGNCGEVRDGEAGPYWMCETIDDGGEHADVAQFVAVSVSPSGLVSIAYSEYNDYDDETYLKVAQQHYETYLPLIIR